VNTDLVNTDIDTRRLDALRRICLLDYLLHIVGLLLSAGMLSVIALIINYVKKDDARGTIYESHMRWMIRTFWWTLAWILIIAVPAALLTVISFGLFGFVFLLPALWFLYRMVRGLLALTEGRAMPLPGHPGRDTPTL
jgi:uncharacterized membrane protein